MVVLVVILPLGGAVVGVLVVPVGLMQPQIQEAAVAAAVRRRRQTLPAVEEREVMSR